MMGATLSQRWVSAPDGSQPHRRSITAISLQWYYTVLWHPTDMCASHLCQILQGHIADTYLQSLDLTLAYHVYVERVRDAMITMTSSL